MLEQVLSVLGGRPLERWLALALQPMVFGLCCAGALLWSDGDLDRVRTVTAWLEKIGTPVTVVLVIALLLGLAGAGLAALALSAPLLRFLHGTGPLWWLGGHALARASGRRTARVHRRWQRAYAPAMVRGTDPRNVARYQRLELARLRRPADPAHASPTRLGNIARASERRIADRYGLDAVVLWPCFSAVLPEGTLLKAEQARSALDRATAAILWGVTFAASMWPFTRWAIPLGLMVVPIVVYGVLPERARRFGNVLEAAFAVHRGELYRALRLPLPGSPVAEPAAGEALTSYVLRGSDDPAYLFTP